MRLPFFGKIEGERGDGDRGVVEKLEELYRVSDGSRRQVEPEWYANAQFLVGNQHDLPTGDFRQWLTTTRLVPRISKDDDPYRMTVNLVYTLFRQAGAGVVDNLGRQICVASTQEPLDVAAAAIGSDFLRSRYDEDNEKRKRMMEVLYTMVCGRSYRKTAFDPDATGNGEFGELDHAGDIVSETVSPVRLLVDPWSDMFENCSFVIESELRDVDELNDLYPGHDIQPEDVLDGSSMLDAFLSNTTGDRTFISSVPKRKRTCVLKKLYARPRNDLPNGRVVYWANLKLLKPPTELPSNIFPFDAFDWMPIPGRGYPLPFITPLRDPQKQYNSILSLLIRLAHAQIRGDVIVQGDGEVRVEEDKESGRKITYIPYGALKYELARYDLNPTVAETRLAQLWNDCQQLAGVRDPSLGENPPGVKTVGALMLLREADTAGLSFFRVGIDHTNEGIGRKKIKLAKEHFHIRRLVRVVGEENRLRAFSFFGAELRDTQDVRTRSMPPLTELERRQVKQQLIAEGRYGPYVDANGMFDPRVKRAHLEALLASGLPEIDEEVDRLAAPMTMDQLRELCSQLDAIDTQTATGMAQMRLLMVRSGAMMEPEGAAGAPPQREAAVAQ